MNKPLIVIIIVSFIYILSIALTSSQKLFGNYAELEYGYIDGQPKECLMLSEAYSSGSKLQYVIQKTSEGISLNFFCLDDEKSEAKLNSKK